MYFQEWPLSRTQAIDYQGQAEPGILGVERVANPESWPMIGVVLEQSRALEHAHKAKTFLPGIPIQDVNGGTAVVFDPLDAQGPVYHHRRGVELRHELVLLGPPRNEHLRIDQLADLNVCRLELRRSESERRADILEQFGVFWRAAADGHRQVAELQLLTFSDNLTVARQSKKITPAQILRSA